MADYTSIEDEQFFGAIGRLTISWAYLEFGLDCFVEIMHYEFGGQDIEPEIPRALQRKITYLRKVINKLPIEQDAINGYLGLFKQIEDASQIRHDVIHGIIIEHAERSGEANMVRAIRNSKGVTKRHYKMTRKDILEAARDAQRLGSKVFHWVNGIHDLIAELSKRPGAQNPS